MINELLDSLVKSSRSAVVPDDDDDDDDDESESYVRPLL